MSATDVADVVHAVPGRLRVRLRGWDGERPADVVARLRRLPGVLDATASATTGNALLRYDPRATGVDELLTGIGAATPAERRPEETAEREDARLAPLRRDGGRARRARVAVRGIDRDPRIARRVVERLRAHPGVRRVQASPLTGRVLIELSADHGDLEDVLAEIADVELPEEPGEDRPAHPLDPAPLVQSAARLIGAAEGLMVLAGRRLRDDRDDEPPRWAVTASAIIGVAEGLPPVRRGLEAALGHDMAQLVLGGASIVTLTLAGTPLGLLVTGIGALRLFTEVRARRAAWRDYEERVAGAASADAGETIRLEAGERVPLRGRIVEGAGTGIGRDGLPEGLVPGASLEAGTRVFGGPFVVELLGGEPFVTPRRPRPLRASGVERYVESLSLASLGYAALTFVATRSLQRAFVALLLVNPRPALVGADAADLGASARVLRAGVTVVGTRPERAVARPDTIVLESPRVVTDGFELTGLVPVGGADAEELAEVVAAISPAAGSPWGSAVRTREPRPATDGRFDGVTAEASVEGRRYALGPPDRGDAAVARHRGRGEHLLALRGPDGELLARVALRPRLTTGLAELVARARARGTEVILAAPGDRDAARAIGRRGGLPLVVEAEALEVVRERQASGARVALVADGAHAAEGFAAADLGVGLTSGRSGRFPAQADLLAPDLSAVAAIIDAGALGGRAANASIAASVVANVTGAAWLLRGGPGVARASLGTYVAALSALGAGWALLRGGTRSRSVAARLVDPRPERWGRRSGADALRELDSTPSGLTSEQAAGRLQPPRRPPAGAGPLLRALTTQLRSPLTAVLAASAGLSFATGSVADVPIIAAVVAANAAIGAWQEHQANRAGESLRKLSAPTARVLRDGEVQTVAGDAVVPGDVLVLAPGDHVVADARLLQEEGLELDEAALTGESLPARKRADAGADVARVVLDGSDVSVGHGRAVVVAVGRGTRLGAIASALALDEPSETPLGRRLGRLLSQSLPVIVGGGLVVVLAGLLRRRPAVEQLALGASSAVAAVPEGLPLLAGVAEAAVARRLARRGAYVRRIAAVEALGRVDVACFDKTGTLTQGRPAVARVTDVDGHGSRVEELPADLREVLAVAAVAGPHPDAPDARAHPTDRAVLDAASAAGLADAAARPRGREARFDSARAFHAAEAGGRVFVKGAAEVLVPRCTAARRGGGAAVGLDDAGRAALLAVAERLASDGLRVLMVAEGPDGEAVEDPRDLTALGFVGISDPLRPGAADAVRRCREAGVRLVMLTGDHPATARAIARDAGLATDGPRVLTGDEFALLDEAALDERLEDADVIARITPLDKLRIVESLQRRGHTVAMTGDGVNDAPALRLADVGVAMGMDGTDVAREAAAVVLADDDLAALVDALVEGRGFWRNMRHALALLLGGNLGELGLIAGSAVAGRHLMTTRQILSVNLVTDVLPALAVAMQEPEHRQLSALTREGAAALDAPLRNDILTRGLATAAPSVAASLLADMIGEPASTVAFASVVATQLAQTTDVGRADGRPRRSVALAVAVSGGLTAAAIAVPPLRGFLGLAPLGPLGATLVLVASVGAVALARALRGADVSRAGRAAAGSGPERRPTARAAALSPA